jgi:hypothetical protein
VEWGDFQAFICKHYGISELGELNDMELEPVSSTRSRYQDEFVIRIFFDKWRESEVYEQRQPHYEQRQSPYGPPPPDDGGDPYGGYSADMFYDKLGDSGDEYTPQPHDGPRVRVALRVRYGRSVEVKLRLPKVDYENDYEQMCESELARQERISLITGRPWHEVPEGAVLGWHWTDDLGSDRCKWPQPACQRMSRVQQPREPPPLRDDPPYGPRANNPQGDERFRLDRMAWFERVTGESLEGVSLTQQWQRVDSVARAFRADTRAGRPGRQS